MLRLLPLFLLSLVLSASFLSVSLSGCSVTSTECDTIASVSAETARFICGLVGQIKTDAALLSIQGRASTGALADYAKLETEIVVVKQYLDAQAETSHKLAEYFQTVGNTDQRLRQETRAEMLLDLSHDLTIVKDSLRGQAHN